MRIGRCGNSQGVVLKYSEPEEARKPKLHWRLYPFKGTEALRMWLLAFVGISKQAADCISSRVCVGLNAVM